MPKSADPEQKVEMEVVLDRLSVAVESIAVEVGTSRARAEQAESEYGQLREVVSGSGGPVSGDLEERLKVIAAENQHLREILAKAREKAERLRSRLAVVEDEV